MSLAKKSEGVDTNDSNVQNSVISGTRGVLFFFLRFLAASVLLYLLYLWAGVYYMRLVAYGARPLLAVSGYKFVMEPALRITEEISLNPVVFFSLVIAVANIRIRTRLRAAVIGFLILTAANSITVFLSFLSAYRDSESLWTGTEFFNLTINFFLPLLLWFLLLPLRSLVFQPRRREE